MQLTQSLKSGFAIGAALSRISRDYLQLTQSLKSGFADKETAKNQLELIDLQLTQSLKSGFAGKNSDA